MSLTYIRYKIKGEVGNMGIFCLSIIFAFELGFLWADDYKKPPIYQISGYFSLKSKEFVVDDKSVENNKKPYVASKNGKNYYFTWCSGVGRIKEENKVYFEDKEDAEKQGFKPSKSCHGL